METRVDPEDVLEIFQTELAEDELFAFIQAAHTFINTSLSSSGLTDDQLFEIERWLTAHLACSREKITTSESIAGASDAYAIQIGLGLDGSFYGQQVKMLDTSGTLTNLDKRYKRATLEWLGSK